MSRSLPFPAGRISGLLFVLLGALGLVSALPAQQPADPPLPDGAIARLGSPLCRVTNGHLPFLALSADGRDVIVVDDGTLRAIDFDTGRDRWSVPAVGCDPLGALLPGGRLLLEYADKMAVYELKDGRERRRYTTTSRNTADRIASDGRFAAISDKWGNSHRVELFDLGSGKTVWEYADADGVPCLGLGFIRDQSQLVVHVNRGANSCIRVVDLKTAKVVREWKFPIEMAEWVLSADGRTQLAWESGRARTWDTATGKGSLGPRALTGCINYPSLSADGRRLAASYNGEALVWWDMAAGKQLGRIALDRPIERLAISADGRRAVALCDRELVLRRFDLEAGRQLPLPPGHIHAVSQIEFLPGGRSLISASPDGTVRVWDLGNQREVRRWKTGDDEPSCFALRNDGRLAATASVTIQAVTIRVWDVASGTETASMTRPDRNIHVLAFAPKSSMLAATAFDPEDAHTLRLWDAESGKEVGKLPGHPGGARTISFHPDGRLLALTTGTACDAGSLPPSAAVLWNLTTGRSRPLPGHEDRIVLFAPDGRSLAVGRTEPEDDRSGLYLIELASGRERLAIAADHFVRGPMAFSPDGRFLATPAPHTSTVSRIWFPGVQIWDTETGRKLREVPTSDLRSLAFSPDGRTLAAGNGDGTILLWDVSKLRPADPKVEVTEALWSDLAAEAPKAYRAVVALRHAGERGVALLRDKLKPAKLVATERLQWLFADLEHERYAVRQKAAADLAALDFDPDLLRKRLRETKSAEARKVLTKLLESTEGWLTSAERLREVRAVEALQRNATPAARALLKELAAGDPAAHLTREAREALR